MTQTTEDRNSLFTVAEKNNHQAIEGGVFKEKKLSDITGTGHGSAHGWENCGTAPYKVTYYSCRKCGARFDHHYDDEPEIFDAMKKSGVGPECCPDMPNERK